VAKKRQTTFAKLQKERARREKQAAKRERRHHKRFEDGDAVLDPSAEPAADDDLVPHVGEPPATDA
jgi:hypothetical protein